MAGVGGPNPQLFNVAQHRYTVLRDGVADAWNDDVFGEGPTAVEDVDAAPIDDQGELHRIADLDVKAAFLGLLDDAPRAVEARPPT